MYVRLLLAGRFNIERYRILQKKWPGKFYSALAGFIEPGEAFEDAVKRELWEEAGLKVWNVKYHSTQPWVRTLHFRMRDDLVDMVSAFPGQPHGRILRGG